MSTVDTSRTRFIAKFGQRTEGRRAGWDGIMQLLVILLVRSRTDWCAGGGSPLAGDHRSQATFLLPGPVSALERQQDVAGCSIVLGKLGRECLCQGGSLFRWDASHEGQGFRARRTVIGRYPHE